MIYGFNLCSNQNNFQKVRGALNTILQLNDELNFGVVTHSSGNHGQALAWAASEG